MPSATVVVPSESFTPSPAAALPSGSLTLTSYEQVLLISVIVYFDLSVLVLTSGAS
ncbi:MAG: hypothetical protein K2K80_00035 [Clostridia bacterium]|nr:hypothetical protein [Clostridia bacterium]